MQRDQQTLLALDVPIIVRIGERAMRLRDVVQLAPGSIIELTKNAESELDLLVNNVQVGFGTAVKVDENFGIMITYIGDLKNRVEALASDSDDEQQGPSQDEMAEAMLEGQI